MKLNSFFNLTPIKTKILLKILIIYSAIFINDITAQNFNYVIYDCPEGLTTNIPVYPIPNIPKPEKGVTIIDTNFHTTITRISDITIDGIPERKLLNTYSTVDPENSDATKLILYSRGFYVYDANTFQLLYRLSNNDGGSIPVRQDIEPRWDDEDPNIFYYIMDKTFNKFDISTGKATLIRDFANDFTEGAIIETPTKGNPSIDRKYWTFGIKENQQPYHIIKVFTYDLEKDSIIATLDIPTEKHVRYVSTSPFGNRAIVHYWWPDQVTSYNLNFEDPIEIGTLGHADFALTADGKQVRVFINPSDGDDISMIDIETGEKTVLLDLPLMGNWDNEVEGYHISGVNYDTPGWVLVSTYSTNSKSGGTWPHNLLFMLELKKDPRIWLLAHTHSPREEGSIKDYWAEAFATTNKKGTKIFWGSNWDNPGSDTQIDAYQITLPENWWTELNDETVQTEEESSLKNLNFTLMQNYPNPFNPTTTIQYSTPPRRSPSQGERASEGVRVSLKVFNILG
jgi:hypothetical protein